MITMMDKQEIIDDAVAMWAELDLDFARHPKRVKRVVSYQLDRLLKEFPEGCTVDWYFMTLGDEVRTEEFHTLFRYEEWRRINA